MSKMIFHGGTILTMDAAVSGDAVLVDGERIVRVGDFTALREMARDAVCVDLAGKTLMPAFIDAHSHFTQMANAQMRVSLEGIADGRSLVEAVQQYIAEHKIPAGDWVMAGDFDHNLFPGGENPPLSVLDEAAPRNPLAIGQKSGHMGLMNSLALNALNITPETPDPDGGRLGRENGKLTGYLEENAYFLYQKKISMPGPEALLRAYSAAQEIYASWGITTVQEGMVVSQMLPLYGLLMHFGLLKLDLVAYPDEQTFEAPQLAPYRQGYRDHLRIGGIKVILDGSPQGRTAWMRTPYQGTEDCGYGVLSDEALVQAFSAAAEAHTQLLAHCNGDAAAAQFLRCLEESEKEHPELKNLRPVMIHAQLLGLDQLSKAAELGVTASFFAAHVYHWGDIHIRNFGLERASQISPAASAKKAGLPFTFHQDSPVIPPDMWETVWCAVNRITRQGVHLGAEEKISVREALEAVTINAARQYGEDGDKGTITPGKLADLIIVSRDPMQTQPQCLRDIQVLATYKSGSCIYRKQ